jgi:hypothetical protein
MSNAHEMQSAVALWIEADETKGSADAVALVALVSVASEFYSVTVGERQVAVSISDIVNHPDTKTRTAARNGSFVAFGGFEPGQPIPNSCLAGLNRVIRPALLLAHNGLAPTLKTVKADGRETLALAGLPFAMCADYPLTDAEGAATPDFVALVEREIEFRAEKGDDVTRDEAERAVLNAPVTLHPAFKSRGKLKPLTRLMADLSKEAVTAGLAPAPKGRAPRTAEDMGASFTAALALVTKVLREVTESDEASFAFTAQIEADLVALVRLIDAYSIDA